MIYIIPVKNFILKKYLFDATNIVKNNDKMDKWVYSGYGIALNEKSEWHFGNDSARKVVISGVDNRSSSHTETCKKLF